MTLTPKANGYEVRLRYGHNQRKRFLLRCPVTPEGLEQAEEREPRMEAMARKLAAAQAPRALELLEEAAEVAGDSRKFSAVERVVEKICREAGASLPSLVAPGLRTFRQVAEAWCSGRLTRDYPDHALLPEKSDEARREDLAIVSVFFPALGSKAVHEITLDDIDAAKRLIPKGHPNNRRKYAQKLRLVMRLSESPLRLVERAPVVDIPRRVASNLFGFLYPQEEALVLGNVQIPLRYRMLYGYLTRNGCRVGETLQLTWDHIDLETGDIHIDKRWTKTKRARRWVLDTDVFTALGAYHALQGKPSGSALVFPGRGGRRCTVGAVRKRFTSDLRTSGVTRKSLLESADGADALRVHDLRASFVTLSLRDGRDFKWIMTRTGHETVEMLKVYDRLVADANEHHLPRWFVDMSQAVPELRSGGPRVGQAPESAGFMGQFPRPLGTDQTGEEGAKSAENATSVAPPTPPSPTSGPAGIQGVGQSGPPSETPSETTTDSPVEKALAAALTAAIAAQEWELAKSIVNELGERRRVRTAPSVPSLDAARRKRDEGGK